jgi:hypothetical protein
LTEAERNGLDAALAEPTVGEGYWPLDLIEGALVEAGFKEIAQQTVRTRRHGPEILYIYQHEDGDVVAWTEHVTEMESFFEGWAAEVNAVQTTTWTATGTEAEQSEES